MSSWLGYGGTHETINQTNVICTAQFNVNVVNVLYKSQGFSLLLRSTRLEKFQKYGKKLLVYSVALVGDCMSSHIVTSSSNFATVL